jgi:Domain of unknown function (DUF1992)
VSPMRRDPDGRPEVGPTWESLVERQIREAKERGDFDDLAFHGRPLPRLDDTFAGDQALGFTILRNAGTAPPWIEADKEARRLLEERDSVLRRAADASPMMHGRYRTELTNIVRAFDRAVAALNAGAPTYRQHRLPLDEAAELAALERLWQSPDT